MYNQAALEVQKRDSASLVEGKPYSTRSREDSMKYMISWNERPQGSPAEYEKAQTRILEVFGQWKAPANFKIEFFVIRVGDWGGYLLVDCDDPLTLHKFCSMLPAFTFEVRSVVPVADAVRAELEVMAWRDGLKIK
jgi:muconolactone delta-isomerase